MRLKKNYIYLFFLFCYGCTTTSKPTENVTILKPTVVPQAPSIVTDQTSNETSKAPENTALSQEEFKDLLKIIKEIEESFTTQKCQNVLDKAKELENFSSFIELDELPSLAKSAVFFCDAKAGLESQTRVQRAIDVLKKEQLRYPIFNEAWLRNALADFYIAIGDKSQALNEKRTARDLIFSQQLDISSLNAQILQLNPSEQGISFGENDNQGNDKNQTIDQIVTSAQKLINNDAPEQAIALLDTIPQTNRSDAIKRLRSDAVNSLVTNLRYKVRQLFERASQQEYQSRKETLTQCEQILQGIIKNYPEYSEMSSVKNNLKQVQRELAKPLKGSK